MIYKEIRPDKLLVDFVKCYWWFDNPTAKQLDFTILPDGCFDLIVSFSNYKQNDISLTGLWTKQVEVSIEPNTQLFGIRFKLLATEYLLQQNISSFCNSERQLKNNFWDIDKISFLNLRASIKKLNTVMLSILGSQKGIDGREQKLFNSLYVTNGGKTVEKYSQQVCWTSRQINRYFKERFGLSLKAYCNILRCHASYGHIKTGQLYPEQNYFDQSHFIKEMKKHTGNNPKELFTNKNDRFLQFKILTQE